MVEPVDDETGPSRRDKRMAQRRQLIIDAAAEEFCENGYEATSLDTVAARVGLSKAGLYYYVKSKEDLFAQLLVEAGEAMDEHINRHAHDNGSSIQSIRAFIAGHVEWACEGGPLAELIVNHLTFVSAGESGDRLRELRRSHEERLSAMLADGMKRRELATRDVRPTAALVLSRLNSVPRWWKVGDPLLTEDVAALISTIAIDGLRSPADVP